MVMNKVMININEAKTHLSRYARRVKQGERIILCDRNIPFAEIRPLTDVHANVRRPFGLAKGLLKVSGNTEKSDEEIAALFAGE